LHRATPGDDGADLQENLIDQSVIKTTYYLIFDQISKSASQQRKQEVLITNPPQLYFALFPDRLGEFSEKFQGTYSWLKKSLPPNVHLMNVKTLFNGNTMLRFHHMFGANEDATLSQPGTVNLQDLFLDFVIEDYHETTLTGNMPAGKPKMQWNLTAQMPPAPEFPQPTFAASKRAASSITIDPMNFKTLSAKLKYTRHTQAFTTGIAHAHTTGKATTGGINLPPITTGVRLPVTTAGQGTNPPPITSGEAEDDGEVELSIDNTPGKSTMPSLLTPFRVVIGALIVGVPIYLWRSRHRRRATRQRVEE